jgi:hypothetical protein
MQPGEPHLAVDNGTARAGRVGVAGRAEPLPFGGALALSSAVHTAGHGEVVVGGAVWQRAAGDPDGFAPAPLAGWGPTLGRAGGMLIGIGIACTLGRRLGLRVVLGVFLGVFLAFFGFLVVGAGGAGAGVLAVAYAFAVAAWWAYRLWVLLRLPRPRMRTDRQTVSHDPR